MSDFNAGFSFDVEENGFQLKTQAPWEFSGALKLAQNEVVRGTTIDSKIQNKIRSRPKHQQRPSYSDDEDDSEADDDIEDDDEEDLDDESEDVADSGSDSEDAPLPGEEEEEDDDEEEVDSGDDDDGLGGSSEGDDDEAPVLLPKKGKKTGAAEKPKDATKAKQGKHSKGRLNDDNETNNNSLLCRAPKGTSYKAVDFSSLNLSRPLLRACEALGYTTPTPIQAACIPLALAGRDICGSAITGSGKTAAFGLPILERLLHRNKRVLATYALILTPARELAVQVHSMLEKLAQFTDIRVALVVGGLSLQSQAAALRDAPEVVVATPGRMIDHLRNSQGVGLEDLQTLILDEADRLLEMGFKEEVHEIVRSAPYQRQTLLFSATMTEEVRALASLSLKHPVRLAADAISAAPRQLIQEIVRLKGNQSARKEAALLALCSRSISNGRAIVFFGTKQRAHRAKIVFGLAGLPFAVELHGDMTQAARLESLERFRKGEAAFLLATDVAARGLDILGLQTVINYDCPKNLATYLHRVGRTARAGTAGLSITFITDDDRKLLKEVIKKTKTQMRERQLPPTAIGNWQEKVDGMAKQILEIQIEERQEKELRKAEMQAEKAANMIEHEKEIYARPARTWFQSTAQKKEIEKQAKAAATEGDNPQSAKDKSKKRSERKQAAAKEQTDANKRKRNNALMEETALVNSKIRAVKSREHKLREEGVPAAQAIKMAAAMVAGQGKSKNKKAKKAPSGDGLFDGDGDGKNAKQQKTTKVYAGGARSRAPVTTSKASKMDLNKVKRGGKGKNSFKSKAKHKRRR